MFNPIKKLIDRKAQEATETAIRKYVDEKLNKDSYHAYNEQSYAPETKQDYSVAFERSIWACAAVSSIAANAAQLPLRIYRKGTDTELTTGPFYDLVNYPNDDQGYYDFMEAIVAYLELTGDAFIEVSNPSSPNGLKPIRSYWMEIQVNKDGTKKYLFKPNGTTIQTLDEEECFHLKYFHPNSELYGFSKMQSATNSIISDFYATSYTKKYYEQGGMINLYVTVKNTLQEFEHKRLKQEIKEQHTGIKNAHQMPVLDSDAQIKTAGDVVSAVLLKEQRDQCRDEILTAFGVPPVMLGTLGDMATYNNSEIQKKAFWESTMLPKLRKIESQLNRLFFIKHGYEVRFDLSGIKSILEDEAKQSTTASTLVKGGIITPNEARATYYNLEPIDGGDELLIPTQNPFAEQPMAKRKIKKSVTDQVNFYLLKSTLADFNTNFDKGEARLFEKLKPIFNSMNTKVQAKLDTLPVDKIEKENQVERIAGLLDSETQNMMREILNNNEQTFRDTSTTFLRNSSRSGRNVAQRVNTLYQANREHVTEWANASADSIIKSSQQQLANTLDLAVRNHWEIDKIRKEVTKVFEGDNEIKYPRAQLIARTESARIVNYSNNLAAEDSGYTKKKWITKVDGKERDDHNAANGQTVGINDAYNVGGEELQYPGDGSPAQCCNCRCCQIFL